MVIGELCYISVPFYAPFLSLGACATGCWVGAEYYLVSSTVPQDGEARRSVAARITQLGPASQLLIHVLS